LKIVCWNLFESSVQRLKVEVSIPERPKRTCVNQQEFRFNAETEIIIRFHWGSHLNGRVVPMLYSQQGSKQQLRKGAVVPQAILYKSEQASAHPCSDLNLS